MKIFLINDTADHVHAGSDAVMRNLRRYLHRHEIVGKHRVGDLHLDQEALAKADWVLVNGEGTIHHNQKTAVFILDVLRQVQLQGTQTALVNTIYQAMNNRYLDVISNLSFFSVRDPWSQKIVAEKGIHADLFVDMCVDEVTTQAGIAQKEADICRGDAHGEATLNKTFFKIKTKRFLEKLSYPVVPLEGKFEDVVATLKQGRLYITGQYHGVYAAAAAGVPFVPFPSNSHKIEALIDWSGLPIPICRKTRELNRTIGFALSNFALYREFSDFILSLPRHDAGYFTEHLVERC